MDLKFISKLFVINFTIAWTLCFTFEDVCHPEDKRCLRPSIRGLGNLLWGRCCSLGVLRRIVSISLLECAKECFLTTGCFSLNYRHNWHLCELLERHKNGESNCNVFLHDEGCIHSNISTWPKKLYGECVDHNCAAGQRCYFDVGTGVNCKVACKYCNECWSSIFDCSSDLPNVSNASPDEYFGPSRDVRHGVKFKCAHNFRLVGKPYVTCSDRGGGRAEWEILFTCYQENCPHDKEYLYSKDLHICYKLLLHGESQYNYQIAKQKCRQENAFLMRIDMQAKYEHIVRYLRSHNRNDQSSPNWRYDDGTQMDYFNWGTDQPDGTSYYGTDYLSLYKPDYFKMHDVWTTGDKHNGIPLCEIELAP
ncbi:unnamed protein product [Mytilus edulis]|uniref:Sushi domain-containing protein n=1 Tax=Mytilus edulis TaxID=6550 RepID=A0A8S3RU88_MYTED|nr:unnamed protein product [Mytilus edulis]